MTQLVELIRSLLNRDSPGSLAMASVDPGTGLPTRAALIVELRKTLSRSKHKVPVALAIVEFRDIGGGGIDDQRPLLKRLATLLRTWVPSEHVVGHLREGEFAIIFRALPQVEIQNLASHIVENVRREPSLEGRQRQIVTTFGVGYASRSDGDASHLLTLADIALNYASSTGRTWHAIVDTAFSPGTNRRGRAA